MQKVRDYTRQTINKIKNNKKIRQDQPDAMQALTGTVSMINMIIKNKKKSTKMIGNITREYRFFTDDRCLPRVPR